jgi:hypothetical protein
MWSSLTGIDFAAENQVCTADSSLYDGTVLLCVVDYQLVSAFNVLSAD